MAYGTGPVCAEFFGYTAAPRTLASRQRCRSSASTADKSFVCLITGAMIADDSKNIIGRFLPSIGAPEWRDRTTRPWHDSGAGVRKTRLKRHELTPADSFDGFAEFFTEPDDSLNFNTVIKLSADSILNRKDNLRAFMFAFTALDSFLRDFFKQHKQALLQHRKAGLSPEVQTYVEDIEESREKRGSH